MARVHYYYQAMARFLRVPGSSDSGGGASPPALQLQDGTNILLQDGSPILLQ